MNMEFPFDNIFAIGVENISVEGHFSPLGLRQGHAVGGLFPLKVVKIEGLAHDHQRGGPGTLRAGSLLAGAPP